MSKSILEYFKPASVSKVSPLPVAPKAKPPIKARVLFEHDTHDPAAKPLTVVPQKSDKTIVCFTDGSSLSNGKKDSKCGFSTVFPYHPEFDGGFPLKGLNQTNNRAELSGIIKSYEIADIIDPSHMKTLIIYTDSELCIKSLSVWLLGWKKKGWKKSDGKPVLNIDLLKIADALQGQRPHAYRHVRAHTGKNDFLSMYNDKADYFAKQAAIDQKKI